MKYQYEVQLAGLLHDIGKFYRKSCKQKGKVAGVEVSGGHPSIGKEFIEYHRKLFENANLDVRALSEMVLRHHSYNYGDKSKPITQDAPKDLVSYCNIVNVADNMSSTSDRGEDSDKVGSSEYRPLRSVYGTLHSKEIFVKMGTKIQVYDDSTDLKESDDERKLAATKMIEDFSDKLSNLEKENIKNPKELYNKMYSLVEAYTKCVNPATNDSTSDASLFDHSSTTSAIASCIHKNLYSKDGDNFKYTKYSDVPSNISIVKINLKFNKYLQNNRAGKNRMTLFIGKSLNVQRTLDEIINGILDMTELPISNILARSSTEYYILIPDCCFEDIRDYLKNKNKELFKDSESQMYIDFKLGNFNFSKGDDKVSFYSNIHNSKEYKGLDGIFIQNNKWDLSAFESSYNITQKTKRCLYCGKLTESDICDDCCNALRKIDDTLDTNFSILYFKDFEYRDNIINGFSDNLDKSTISRVATYMRLNSDFFGEEVGKLLRNSCESAKVMIHNIDSCYVVCKNNETYKVANIILGAYKDYTGNTMRLICSIKEYKKNSKLIDFVSDCEKTAHILKSHNYEVNVGKLGFMHRDTGINLISYMNILNRIDKIALSGSSKSLLYKVLGYVDELMLYAKTEDASHLMSLSLLTKESRKGYNPEEIKLIEEVIGEAKRLVASGKIGRLGIYREALNRILRNKED